MRIFEVDDAANHERNLNCPGQSHPNIPISPFLRILELTRQRIGTEESSPGYLQVTNQPTKPLLSSTNIELEAILERLCLTTEAR
jgi:hypothetical protein